MANEPKMVTAASLMTQVQPFTQNANELQSQADRAEIVTTEDFGKATDFIKICTAQILSLEDARKALTKPLNDHVSWINDQIRPIREGIEAAKAIMNRKGAAWKVDEDKRVAAEAAEKRRLAEEQAIKDAEEAQDQGDTAKAEAIIEAASETPQDKQTADNVRGAMTGATGGLRGTWMGEVDDIKEICAAVVRGIIPATILTVGKAGMNKIAKDQEKEGVWHGVKITHRRDMNVR